MTETTDGTLLGGKLPYRQFKTGHRSGFEPVLLAAAVAARSGNLVLEAGTGAGAALLCLGQRVKGLRGIGIEIDPALAALANENFKTNGLSEFSCVVADAYNPAFAKVFDHLLANPPWFEPAGTHSPDPARARAHHAPAGLLEGWIAGLAGCLKPSGTIYLILPAGLLSTAMTALRGQKFAGMTLLPLWPHEGQPAKQFIIAARQASRAADRILPGLILHDEGGITPAANAILRDGAALSF